MVNVLQNFGLSGTESSLYELLLNLGEVPVAEIINQSGLKRPTVYKALYSLENKGLVSSRDFKKKIHFKPESPLKLVEQVENTYAQAQQVRNTLQVAIPQLLSAYTLSTQRPIVKVYEGIEGMKKAHLEEILPEKKEILAYVLINEEIDHKLDDFWKKYYRIRVKENKMFVRSITPNTKAGIAYKKADSEQLRETRLVPFEKFPINIEKNIVGNKVAYFSTTPEGKLISTIIENKEIANAERSIFELVWSASEKFNE